MAFLDEIGLTELWSRVKSEDAKLAAADLRFELVSRAGTDAETQTITFSFTPKIWGLIATITPNSDGDQLRLGSNMFIAPWGVVPPLDRYGDTPLYIGSTYFHTLVYSGNSVTFGNNNGDYNKSGYTYYYFAIG